MAKQIVPSHPDVSAAAAAEQTACGTSINVTDEGGVQLMVNMGKHPDQSTVK